MTEKTYEWLGEDSTKSEIIPYDRKEGTLYATLDRTYDEDFIATEDFKASMADLQNGPSANIQGSHEAETEIDNIKITYIFKKNVWTDEK